MDPNYKYEKSFSPENWSAKELGTYNDNMATNIPLSLFTHC
jgi:hypothetical protein